MTVLPLAALKSTVRLTLPAPSPTVSDEEEKDTLGGSSSSVIVTVAWERRPRVAFDGDLSLTLNVSLGSSNVSLVIGTSKLPRVSPAEMRSVPVVRV